MCSLDVGHSSMLVDPYHDSSAQRFLRVRSFGPQHVGTSYAINVGLSQAMLPVVGAHPVFRCVAFDSVNVLNPFVELQLPPCHGITSHS